MQVYSRGKTLAVHRTTLRAPCSATLHTRKLCVLPLPCDYSPIYITHVKGHSPDFFFHQQHDISPAFFAAAAITMAFQKV